MTIKELEEQSGISVYMRSCWECNSAHERLKKVDYIIFCFECGRLWYKGKPLEIDKLNELKDSDVDE